MLQSRSRSVQASTGRAAFIALLAVACLGMAWCSTAAAAPRALPNEPDLAGALKAPGGTSLAPLPTGEARYIVVLKDSIRHPGAVAADQADESEADVGFVYRSAIKGYSAVMPKEEVEALEEDPRVSYVTPDRKVSVTSQSIPAGVSRIFAPENETLAINEKEDVWVDADVAVIDTGIDYEHPDLNVIERTNCVPAGEDWETEYEYEECVNGAGHDGYGHGTHVAGTVGALDNGQGVMGVAPGARLWAVRALNNQSLGVESWIIAGVDWVTAHADQIEVANVSLGCECSMPALEEAIEASTEAGVVYVIAAGNNGKDVKYFSPAKNPDAITVSALNLSDKNTDGKKPKSCISSKADNMLASFSNFGEGVDVTAPGTCVYSTLPDGEFWYLNGTSMAAPHVTGAAAILASEENPEDLGDVEAIAQQIEEEGSSAWEDTSGDGVKEPLLDVNEESAFAAQGHPVTQPATIVSESKATLHGLVSPGGLVTSYRFEYGTSTAYGSSAPTSPKSIGSGTAYVSVEEPLEGLKGQTLYHYRVVATNSAGSFYGNDRTFATTLPTISLETPTVNANDATLKGSINPKGSETIYWFEYGTTSSYGSKAPAPPKSVGSGIAALKVSVPVGLLTGSKTYYYRLNATNAAGTVHGEDQTFTTQSAEWTRQQSASNGDAERELRDVSCSSRSDCMAVGWRWSPSTGELPLGEHWNGEEWSVLAVPNPAKGGDFATLEGVSCASARWCVASGWYWQDEEPQLLIEQWDGAEWSLASIPSIRVSMGHAPHVSCVSANACMVVAAKVAPDEVHPIAASWNGEGWSLQSMPEPANTNWAQVGAVSCASTTSCVAVGTYETNSLKFNKHGGPLAEQWDGEQWSIIQDDVPGPVKGASASLYADVSCAAPDSCTAILLGGMEVEHWDGEGWTLESVPEPAGVEIGAEETSNLGISCPTVSFCTIVGNGQRPAGSYFMGDRLETPRTATWDGVEWSAQSSLDPAQEEEPNGFFSGLKGVSCISPSSCVGVGITKKGGDGAFWDVIERYQAPGPVSETDPATKVTSESASFNATVDPGGSSTSYQFEYGTTTAYGSKAPTLPKGIGSGTGGVVVDEVVEGLLPNKTYHFRVVATNAKGTTYGEDRTFKTVAVPHFVSSFGKDGEGGGELHKQFGVAIDSEDNIWVADTGNDRIEKFSPEGELLLQVGSSGTGAAQFDQPYGIAVDSEDNVWVADSWNNRLQKLNSKGEFVKALGWGVDDGTSKEFQFCISSCFAGLTGKGNGQLYRPYSLSFDSKGNLWVADTSNLRVQKLNSKGEYQSQFDTSWPGSDLAVDANGDLWVVEYNQDRVTKFDPTGKRLIEVGDEKGSGHGQFDVPTGVGIDPKGNIWVTDSENERVQELNPAGEYMAQIGEGGSGGGQMDFPRDVAFDSEEGIWVADSYNSRIQKWTHAPSAVTEAATKIRSTRSTLNASVNPEGFFTSYYFEYGKTNAYGSKVPVSSVAIGEGSDDLAVSQTPTGLAENTIYHYRVVAESSFGTTKGQDQTLTTTQKAVWLKEGDPLEEGAEIALSGNLKFETLGMGIDCDVSATIATAGGDTAEVTAFNVVAETCEGFGLIFEGCKVSDADVLGLPWAAQVGDHELILKGVTVDYTFAECSLEGVESMRLGPGEITAELDDPEGFSNATLTGESVGLLHMGGEENELNVSVEGALEVLESAKFVGDLRFETLGTGVDCDVNATLATDGGATAEVTAFNVATASCEGFGFLFEGCEVSEAKAPSLPWAVEVDGEELTLKGVMVDYTFAECSLEGVESMRLGPGEITAELDDPEGFSNATLTGESVGLLHMGGEENELNVSVEGALEVVDQSKPGRYGVG